MKALYLLCAAMFSLIACNTALAKESADLCGQYTSVDMEEKTVNISNGTQFLSFRSSTQMNAAEGSKYNQLSGQCSGGAVIYPDRSIEAEGLCVVTDIDGDVLTYTFTQARQAKDGKFARKGGTGKFAGAKETGWYRPLSLNGDLTTGEWGGKSSCK